MATLNRELGPWYRNRWPWFIIAWPAAAVIMGSVTLWLAITTNDGLVVDDYYKQGLAVQQTMARSEHAADLGLEAQLRLRAGSIELDLGGKSGAVPSRIRVIFSRPARAGMDQILTLDGAQGAFRGVLPELALGRWDIQIEDEPRTWRLNGAVNLPTETVIRILPTTLKPVD